MTNFSTARCAHDSMQVTLQEVDECLDAIVFCTIKDPDNRQVYEHDSLSELTTRFCTMIEDAFEAALSLDTSPNALESLLADTIIAINRKHQVRMEELEDEAAQ